MKFSIRKLLILSAVLCQSSVFAQSVGSIDGVYNVSDLGEANYRIPIHVPDGVSGLKPDLALAYSSQAGNGLLGRGWSLSGLSVITRSPNNIYNDKKTQAVNLTLDDKYSLDGSRLIPSSGAYNAAGTKYHTEVETFKEVSTVGTLGNGPLSFSVIDNNGLTYEYGLDANSRAKAPGSTEPNAWYLSKVKDMSGNYMIFEYSNTNGEVVPTVIRYNYLSGATQERTFVSFTYGSNTTPNFTYSAGGKFIASSRLSSINVYQYVNSTSRLYRSYSMTYEDDFYTHLKTVTEKGTEATETLPSTVFTYGLPTSTYATTDIANINSGVNQAQFISGDFNGDGLSDVIRFPTDYFSTYNDWVLFKNTGNGFTSVQSAVLPPMLPTDNNVKYDFVHSRVNGSFLMNFNGDGYDDFIYSSKKYFDSNKQFELAFTVFTSNGSSLALAATVSKTLAGDAITNVTPITGDFDGDGKTEILAVGSSTGAAGSSAISYLVGDKYLTAQSGNSAPLQIITDFSTSRCNLGWTGDPKIMLGAGCDGVAPKVFPIDYNGDGKTDIMWVNNSTASIYELNVTFDANNNPVIGSPAFKLVSSGGYPTAWHDISLGDFNGDGITDVLTYSPDFGWGMGYGTGKGFFEGYNAPAAMGGKPLIYTGATFPSRRPVIVGDFNGDGLSDIYNYAPSYYTSQWGYTTPQIYYSKGNNTFLTESLAATESIIGPLIGGYCLGDFNGDGGTEFISAPTSVDPNKIFSFHPNEKRHLLSKVQNGFGAITQFQYKNLSDPSVSSLGYIAYPYVSRCSPIKVVSRSIEDNGVNTTGTSTSYFYSSLKYSAYGKGMLGFDKVTTFNEGSGLRKEKSYTLNTTYALPVVSSIYITYNPNAQTNLPMSSTLFSTDVYSYGGGRIFSYPTTTVENNSLTGENKTTTYSYVFSGAFRNTLSQHMGKPFTITVKKGGTLDISTQTFTFPNYASAVGVQYPGCYFSKPNTITTTNTRLGQTAYTRKSSYSYSTATGLLSSSISDMGTSNAVTTTFEYDSYNNITRKVISAPGLTTRDERMDYDPSGRYILDSYNAAFPNIKSYSAYDVFTGLKLAGVDPDGYGKAYNYDAFGRLKNVSDNTNSIINSTYAWGDMSPADNVPVSNAVYYVKNTSNTGAISYTNFDRLGRELKTSTKNFQNVWINTTRSYNAIGQLASTTKPTSGLTYTSIIYNYDGYGRITQKTASEGNVTYAYSPPNSGYCLLTETNATPGLQTKMKTDASGKKVEVTDAMGNVLSYTYASNGEEKTVAAGGVTLSTNNYDAYGRLTDKTDPNYGTYYYTYDAFGQKLTQKDPRSQTYTYSYDALGRMYQKMGPDGTYTYTYENNVGANCGKMITKTGNAGSTSYTYGLGPQISTIHYSDGGNSVNHTGSESFPYNLQIGYDALGRASWKQYPTGAKVLYTYSTNNGDLIKISDYNNGKVYFNKTAENDFGEITSYTQNLGQGDVVTNKTFDAFGLLSEQKTMNGAAVLRDFQYTFDPATSNLLSRKDVNRNLTENFTLYDKLNRLQNISYPAGTGLADVHIDFSANGNITQKPDAGNFLYDQANRVSKIENYQNIPTTTQSVDNNSFNKVSYIAEGNYETEFYYDGDDQRNAAITTDNGLVVKFKSYAPDVEREFSNAFGDRTWTYIRGPQNNVVAIVAKENGVDQNYLVLTDHLGSFTHIINQAGAVVEEKSFDAWGRLRNPANWQPYAPSLASGQPVFSFDRGYTGHEHMAEYGIINMNGRLYDPVMGRMFGPDPQLQEGDNFQNYNRYTYCLNNPLKYTDPSGEFFLIPDINWSNGGGLNLGLKFGVGVPGVLSAQVTLGFNPNRNDFYGSIGGTAGGFTLAAGYGTQSGFTINGGGETQLGKQKDWKFASNLGANGLYACNDCIMVKTIAEVVITDIKNKASELMSSFWYSDIARAIVPDKMSLSLGGDLTFGGGVGAQPFNVTVLTRGREPGVYLTPSFNANIGFAASADGSINYTSGWYTGDPREITSSMLMGGTHGVNVSVTALVGVTGGVSYSPVDAKNPISSGGFINATVGATSGAGASATYQYTQTIGVGKLWGW